MIKYILMLLAAGTVMGGERLDALLSAGPAMDYVMAFGVAMMLKPWLQGHFE